MPTLFCGEPCENKVREENEMNAISFISLFWGSLIFGSYKGLILSFGVLVCEVFLEGVNFRKL